MGLWGRARYLVPLALPFSKLSLFSLKPATRLCIRHSARPVPPSVLGGCGPRRWRRAPSPPLPRRSLSPPPPFRPRAREQRAEPGGGEGGKGEREHRVATPPEPAFSRAAAGGSLLAPRSPPRRALLRPSLRSASATPLSELRRLQRESAPSAPPARLPAPGPRGSVPGPPAPRDLAASQVPALLPARPRSVAVCVLPPPPTPSSLSGLLARSLALRPGEAASQENPRNLCKKLTMKFKKFFDFGAIFEWSER